MEIKIKCSYKELVPVTQLVGNPKNSNKHPERQLNLLAKILKYQGWRHPIIVSNLTGYIVAGHGRLEAAKIAEFQEVPVDYQDFENMAQEMAFLESDNLVADLAEHDKGLMLANIMELELADDFDLELFGIPDFEIPEIKNLDEANEDTVPENVDTRCKLGDVWQLGEHKLVCGDSTSIDDVKKLMGEERAGMVFTSPPYNFGKAGFEEKGKYENSKDTDDNEWLSLVSEFTSTWMMFSEYQFINLQILSGNKVKIHEWLYAYRKHFVDQMALIKSTLPAMEKNILNAEFECMYIFKSEEMPKKHIKLGIEFRGTVSNVYQMKRSSGEFAKTHRATFHVSFPEYFIETFTDKKCVIADPFGGSGSTLIACEKTNRKCFMMELDPHYCDVILSRWEKYTGKTAERKTT